MARGFAKRFYRSKAWQEARDRAMTRYVETDRGVCPPLMCERCFSKGVLKPAKIVHHVVHLSPENIGDQNVSLSLDNLMRVCKECHDEIHYGDMNQTSYTPRVRFDEEGRVVPLDVL